jgi:hypothetical protein
MNTPPDGARSGAPPERIDIRLHVTQDRLREAVRAVGSRAMDIEWHLKAGRGMPLAEAPKTRSSA